MLMLTSFLVQVIRLLQSAGRGIPWQLRQSRARDGLRNSRTSAETETSYMCILMLNNLFQNINNRVTNVRIKKRVLKRTRAIIVMCT